MTYEFKWSVITENSHLFLDGLLITLQLSAWAFVLSLPLAVLVALARLSPWLVLRSAFGTYVELFRNTPLLVQIVFFYFAVGLDSYLASIVALTLNAGAFMSEVIRSGIQSIPKTQYEAARSLGLGTIDITGHVILPQALMIVIPPLTTELLNIVRNSSMAMAVGVAELTFQTQQLESISFRGFEAATAVTAIYLALSILIVGFVWAIELAVDFEARSY
jgi:polar amino acid transport system permease protein